MQFNRSITGNSDQKIRYKGGLYKRMPLYCFLIFLYLRFSDSKYMKNYFLLKERCNRQTGKNGNKKMNRNIGFGSKKIH